jgi:hypothetical protein
MRRGKYAPPEISEKAEARSTWPAQNSKRAISFWEEWPAEVAKR